ncbi:EcsC family protein [Eubacteriaceae bacterium ES3]|nr:EcsC family protein [Eubacteriaceae bacterium ES3]
MTNKKTLMKELRRIEKKEQRLQNKKKNQVVRENIDPVIEKVQEKIPQKLEETLQAAFLKGFSLVFEKGTPYIEKTCNKDKLLAQHQKNDAAVDKQKGRKYFHRMKRSSSQSAFFNQSLSAIEGGALGILGIGIPDIPVFIAVIYKSLVEIALHFGYSCESDAEKAYMLMLISASMANDTKKMEYDQRASQLGHQIDSYDAVALDLTDLMKETSEVLSSTLLTTKFIQGLPLVGVLGGLANPLILNKITHYAEIKYQKRYLEKKLDQ